MGIDGIQNDRPAQSDQRHPIGDPRQDPRFAYGRGQTPSSDASRASAAGNPAPLGDDRLQLSTEAPDNPFQALISARKRRKKGRKRDGDPTSLD